MFDAGRASPTLQRLLESGELDVEGKRFLVPGCGRGYDVAAAARAGAALAVGLDLSQAAVAAAEAHHAREPAEVRARMRFVAGDFFAFGGAGGGGEDGGGDGGDSSSSSGGAFGAGYDYTFCCALHPTMRRNWASGWARLLAPGGILVTMVYPVDPARPADEGALGGCIDCVLAPTMLPSRHPPCACLSPGAPSAVYVCEARLSVPRLLCFGL